MMNDILIAGISGSVWAIDKRTGTEVWRTILEKALFSRSSPSDVSVLIDGDLIYAGCNGRVYGLSATTGEILWVNKMKGAGYNEISLAVQGVNTQFISRERVVNN
ncbi:MAG: PQQ-binding-like beta-propeller repeat protein [Chitinophagaceae bacterium]|nr:PQQ-binding-like beta-propeller repeat protein [Chitinophagaceae bacterium]